MATTIQTQVAKYTVGLFGAAPGGYMNSLANHFVAGGNEADFVNFLVNSVEYRTYMANWPAMTAAEKATAIVSNLLSETSGTVYSAGVQAVQGLLDGGASFAAAAYAAVDFLAKATADATYGDYADAFNARVANAISYTLSSDGATEMSLGVLQAQATSEVNLTENLDVRTGNVFNANKGWTPGGTDQVNTLNDDDELTGIGTNPTLNFTFVNDADTGDMSIHPVLTNIQTVNVAFAAGVVSLLDLQDSTGVNALNITRMDNAAANATGVAAAAASYTVDNMTAVPATMSISNSSQNQGDRVDLLFTSGAVSGSTNSTTLTLSNVNVHTLTIDDDAGTANLGVETINLVSSGAANTINTNLSIEDTNTLNISGDQNLTIGGELNAAGSLNKVDASTLTGNLTFTVTAGIMATTADGQTQGTVAFGLTSGTGSDSIRTNEQIATNDSIAAGEGTDTLRMQSNSNVLFDAIQINAAGDNVTGVENAQLWRTGVATGGADELTLRADEMTGDQSIEVRNHAGTVAAGTNVVEATKYNLMNLTATEATGVSIAHSGNTQLANPAVAADSLAANTLNIDVNGATAAKVSIIDGVNADPRFNFQLYTDSDLTVSATGVQAGTVATGYNNTTNAVTSLTIADTDTESNSVLLQSVGSANGAVLADLGTAYMGTGSTITLTGGAATQFLNLDANTDQGYNLDVTGLSTTDAIDAMVTAGTAESVVQGTTVTAVQDYWFLDNGTTAAVATPRLIAETVTASAYLGDVVVRLGDTTRANGVSSQSISGGVGNDTLIFDAQGVKNSGYTSGDTVKGSTGLDTLVIDGNTAALKSDGTAGVTGNVSVQKSEWDNTTGIDVLRLAGNQGVANVGNAAIVTSTTNSGGYYIEIDNDFVKQTDAGNGLVIVNNDGDFAQNLESDLVLNLRPLAQTSNVNFIGANGNGTALISSNRIQLEDNSANGANSLDGGDTTRDGSEGLVSGVTRLSSGNNNVLEVFNTADVSINDLSNTKNFGRIEGTNDLAVAQTLKLVLNDTVMDQLVDAGTAARIAAAGGVTANIERLVVVANNNANVAGAVENLNIDASAVGTKFAIDVLVGRSTTNTITGSAGADKVVILGNYTTAEQTADGHAAVALFAGANALTGAALTTALAPNGTGYKGADGVAGTADDVLLAYTGTYNLGAATEGNVIETFGGVDLSGATIAAGTTILAHSSVKLTEAQLNALTGITFVGTGGHGLQVIDDAAVAGTTANLSKVTVGSATGVLNVSLAGTITQLAGSAATIQSGGTAVTTTAGVTLAPVAGSTTSGGTSAAAGTLTAGVDTYNNSATGTLAASFGGVAGTTPTLNSAASLSTAAASLSNLDSLTFGTGSDTLTFTDAATLTINTGTLTPSGGTAAVVTGLDVIQLANAINNITLTAPTNASQTLKGGTAQDIIGVATALGTNIQTGGTTDIVTYAGTAPSSSLDLGDGDDTVSFIGGDVTTASFGTMTTITGGAGTDTLSITDVDATVVTDSDFAKVALVETIKLNNAGTNSAALTLDGLAYLAGVRNVTLGAGTDATDNTITVGSTYLALQGSTAVAIDATALPDGEALNFGTGTSGLITVSNMKGDITWGGTSSGNLTVGVSSAATTAVAINQANHTGTLTLTGGTAGQEATITGDAASSNSITASSYIGTVKVTYSDLTSNAATLVAGSGNVTVVGGAAGDTITVTGLNTASQTFVGSVSPINVTGGAGAQTFTLSTTATVANTVTGGAGDDVITLAAAGSADKVVFAGGTGTAGTIARVTTLGTDTINSLSGGIDALQFKQADFGVAAGAVSTDQISVVANTSTAVLTDATQNLGAGSFSYSAAGFLVVGTNAAINTVDVYFYDGSKTNAAATRTVAELVTDGDAVKIATVGIITAALDTANFAWVA